MGAWIGDSVGSYLEFTHLDITPRVVDDAMKMPGGGVWKIGPGQVTDDSELAICLMSGIIKGCQESGRSVLDMDAVGRKYAEWVYSKPFDKGVATSTALTPLCSSGEVRARKAIQSAHLNNQESKSNGSLMRCMPLIAWCAKLE